MLSTFLEHPDWIIVQVDQIDGHLMVRVREALLVLPQGLFEFGHLLLQSVHCRSSRCDGRHLYELAVRRRTGFALAPLRLLEHQQRLASVERRDGRGTPVIRGGGLRLGALQLLLLVFDFSGEARTLGVQALHRRVQLLLAEFDLHSALRLEDSAARRRVRVQLNVRRVDGRICNASIRGTMVVPVWSEEGEYKRSYQYVMMVIRSLKFHLVQVIETVHLKPQKNQHVRTHDGPGAAAQLGVGVNVDEHRLRVVHERVDDHRAELEHLLVHLAHAAREAAPIGENEQREALALKVLHRLRCLVRARRVPHLTGQLHALRLGARARRIGSHVHLRCACLGCDHAFNFDERILHIFIIFESQGDPLTTNQIINH